MILIFIIGFFSVINLKVSDILHLNFLELVLTFIIYFL